MLVKKRIFLEQVVQDLEQLEQPVQEKKLGAPSTSIKKIKKLKGKFWTKNEEIKNSNFFFRVRTAKVGKSPPRATSNVVSNVCTRAPTLFSHAHADGTNIIETF